MRDETREMGKGEDYFKANAIREKCTVGKSSGRAPLIYVDFVLVRRGRGDECFDDGRRIVFETAKKERGRRRRRTAKESVLFRRLVSPRAGKKAFHHFPLPLSSIHDSLRHDARRHRPRPLARSLVRERASVPPRDCQRPLSRRASERREGGRGRAAVPGSRRSGRPLGFPDSGDDDYDAPLASDGRTDGRRELTQPRQSSCDRDRHLRRSNRVLIVPPRSPSSLNTLSASPPPPPIPL